LAKSSERALVLHGGGSAGNAWEIGVIAGLYDAGLDVRTADLVIGTSAGATAAAQITSGSPPSELLASILDSPTMPRPGPASADRGRAANTPMTDHMERSNAIIASAADAPDMRRRLGAAALDLDDSTDDAFQQQWRATVAARLPNQDWPPQPLLIVAVDAFSGEPVMFDRGSGVDLADAVAASCANGFGVAPYTIGDSRYIDGGYRRNENADLAAGYGRVLILSPFGGRSRHPEEWGMQLATQVEELRASGSSVETIFPDAASRDAFGDNMMNPASRPPAARAGYAQGTALAQQLTEFWR
jgi:NTE family protein